MPPACVRNLGHPCDQGCGRKGHLDALGLGLELGVGVGVAETPELGDVSGAFGEAVGDGLTVAPGVGVVVAGSLGSIVGTGPGSGVIATGGSHPSYFSHAS